MRRALLLSAASVTAFAVVASLLQARAPWPDTSGILARLLHYEEHADDYDVLYFGSSQVRNSVIPEAVDEHMATRGHEIHSFSFGTEGMHGYEADLLLDDILRHAPERLRWVFIELRYWHLDAIANPLNHYSQRMVNWHTPRQTRLALRDLLERPEPWSLRLRRAGTHIAHALLRFGSVGRGGTFVTRGSGESRDPTANQAIAARGFLAPNGFPSEEAEAARKRFVDDLDGYQARVRALAAGVVDPNYPSYQIDLDALEAQAARVRAAGAEPIYMVLSVPDLQPEVMVLASPGQISAPIWRFNDPDSYPGLYQVDHRWDHDHLNRQGARAFSRVLADRLATWIEEHGPV